MPFSENALTVLKKRYLMKDEKGQPLEQPEDMFRRVARNLALIDILYHPSLYRPNPAGERERRREIPEVDKEDMPAVQGYTPNDVATLYRAYLEMRAAGCIEKGFEAVLETLEEHRAGLAATEEKFFASMMAGEFLPNSPALMNAGRDLQQLSACFVLPVEDSMASIFDSLKHAALIHQSGGGTGFSFSRLRPKNDVVRSTGGVASGPVSFMKVFNAATEAVKQGGCVVPETLVTTDRGIIPIRELGPEDAPADTWHGHSRPLVVATDDGPRTSDEFYNHGVSPIRRIRTRSGYHLAATPEHRIRVIDEEGCYVWRHLGNLRPGDWAVLQKGHLLEPEDYSLPGLSGEPHFNAKGVQLPAEASVELGEFIGYLIGDGSFNRYNRGTTTGRLIVTVCDEQPEVAEWLSRTSHEIFGLSPITNKKEKDGITNYFFNSTSLVNWLQQLGVDTPSAKDVRVPQIIFRKGAGMAQGFLRGLFTAEGSVSEEGHPSLSSVSETLIDDVQQLLLAVGIPSCVSVTTNRDVAFGDNQLFRLRVITGAGLELFARTIGFIDGKRNALLKSGLNKAFEYNDVIPHQEKVTALPGASAPRYPTRSRSAVLAEKRGEIRNSCLTWFMTNDQFYDQIESIEEGEGLTLDLSVPDNNTYIANGFVSHNTRRGANMGILRVDHPDIMEFITCKENNNEVNNFNISVALTDDFMKAVENDWEYDLRNPRNGEVVGRLNAAEVFNTIVDRAWRNGEPGIIFLDRINEDNPTPSLGEIESTNPCGEQPLLPYEACCLGSVNLNRFIAGDGLDWDGLGRTVRTAIHFLDNLIDANRHPLPEVEGMVHANRKIGLGVMGWADALMYLGIPYDSEEAVALAEKVMSFIREESYRASEELAETRGTFPNFEGSVYDREGGPRLRNATTTTIAPTGTISIIGGASSGIEPIFSLAFTRTVLDNDKLVEINPVFEEIAKREGFYLPELMEKVAETGSVRDIPEIPAAWRRVFVTAHDITPEWHIRMQSAFQKYTDNAVSKTVNFPRAATREDVAEVYRLAYRLGCKGVTVYRDGSRESQVLTVGKAKEEPKPAPSPEKGGVNGTWGRIRPIPRPVRLQGFTDVKETPLGKLFLTINMLDDHPVELFAQIGKAGSDVTAFTEGIARLISLALRCGVAPEEVVNQLVGIGGSRTVGFGPNRVRSVPDAIGQFIQEFLRQEREGAIPKVQAEKPPEAAAASSMGLCPSCGMYSLVHVEGCAKCMACGHSEC